MRFEIGQTIRTSYAYIGGRRYYTGNITGVISKVYASTVHITGGFYINGDKVNRVSVRKGDAFVIEPDNIIKLK